VRNLLPFLLGTIILIGCDSAPTAVERSEAFTPQSDSEAAPSQITFRVRTRFVDSVRVDYFLGETDFSGWVSPEWEITLPYQEGPKGMQARGPSPFLGHITSELWYDDILMDTRTAKLGHVRGVVAGVAADLGDSYRVEVELTGVRERARSSLDARWGPAWMVFKRNLLPSVAGPAWEEDAQYCQTSWTTVEVERGDKIRVRTMGEGEVGYTILIDQGLDEGEGEKFQTRRLELLRSRLERSTKTYFYFPDASFHSSYSPGTQ
jgi:hypothetical protein